MVFLFFLEFKNLKFKECQDLIVEGAAFEFSNLSDFMSFKALNWIIHIIRKQPMRHLLILVPGRAQQSVSLLI